VLKKITAKESVECVVQCFPKVLLTDRFRLRKITMDPHILAHVNKECPDYRHPKLDIYTSDLIVGR